MKIWIPLQTKEKNNYAARTILSFTGILLLIVVLLIGSTFLVLYFNLPKELLLAACLSETLLAILLAYSLGRQSLRSTLVFCQDEEGRLFVIDARQYAPHTQGFHAFIKSSVQTQAFLDSLIHDGVLESRLAQPESLTGLETQILYVDHMKLREDGHSLVCRVQYPNGHQGKATYLLLNGYENEDALLYALQCKRSAEGMAEFRENRNPVKIFISILVLAVFICVCALSHPGIGILPEKLYFPSLGLSVIPLYFTLYYCLKQRRGE